MTTFRTRENLPKAVNLFSVRVSIHRGRRVNQSACRLAVAVCGWLVGSLRRRRTHTLVAGVRPRIPLSSFALNEGYLRSRSAAMRRTKAKNEGELKKAETIWWSPLNDDEKMGQQWRLLIPGLEARAFSKVVCSGAPNFSKTRKKQLRFQRQKDQSEHVIVHYVVQADDTNSDFKGLNIHVTSSEMSDVVHRLAPGDFIQAWVPRGQEKKLSNWICTMNPVFHGYVHPYDDEGKPCLQRVSSSAVKMANMVRSLKRLSHHAHMHREHRVRRAEMMLAQTEEGSKDIQVKSKPAAGGDAAVSRPSVSGRRRRSVQHRKQGLERHSSRHSRALSLYGAMVGDSNDAVRGSTEGAETGATAYSSALSGSGQQSSRRSSRRSSSQRQEIEVLEPDSAALAEVDTRLAFGADLDALLEEMTMRALEDSATTTVPEVNASKRSSEPSGSLPYGGDGSKLPTWIPWTKPTNPPILA